MSKTISEIIQKKNCMTWSESVQVMRKLLEITEEAHARGNLLLALFPDNMVVQETEGGYRLAVDTGDPYRRQTAQGRTDPEHRAASVGFRPPEIAVMDHKKIGKQSDYYSITAVFYYCLTGRKLSRLQMFRSGIPDIADAIDRNKMNENAVKILYRILKKGLLSGLRSRYQSLKQMEEDLAELEKCMAEEKENRHF